MVFNALRYGAKNFNQVLQQRLTEAERVQTMAAAVMRPQSHGASVRHVMYMHTCSKFWARGSNCLLFHITSFICTMV